MCCITTPPKCSLNDFFGNFSPKAKCPDSCFIWAMGTLRDLMFAGEDNYSEGHKDNSFFL